MSAVKDFIAEHKRLTIGFILYIAVFFISRQISPWSTQELTLADFAPETTVSFIEKTPVEIIFFGIYELCELMAFSVRGGFSTGGMLMFFISACAVFGYMKIVQDIIINKGLSIFEDDSPELELDLGKLMMNFLYDNVIAYAACLITYYAYFPLAGKVNDMFSQPGFWLKALIVLLIGVFVILPSLPHLLQFFAYILSISGIVTLLNHMDKTIEWNNFLKTAVIFLTALVLIAVMNFIVNGLLDWLVLLLQGYLFGLIPLLVTELGEVLLKLFLIVLAFAVFVALLFLLWQHMPTTTV